MKSQGRELSNRQRGLWDADAVLIGSGSKALAAAKSQTLTGEVSDAMCGGDMNEGQACGAHVRLA